MSAVVPLVQLLKKMEQVRQKANSIADGADMNNRSKAKVSSASF